MPLLNPVTILAILIALSVHEAAHAWVAKQLGDPTADLEGRVTLNPLAHLDPLGALLFLAVGFGWGKPVPVDPRNFRHPLRDNALVALAGPVSNLLLAILSTLLLLAVPQHASSTAMQLLVILLQSSIILNLSLMAFNLLPIAPLDGSKILAPLVPLRYLDRYEDFMRIGPWVLLGVLLAERLLNVPILTWWVGSIVDGVQFLLQKVLGV